MVNVHILEKTLEWIKIIVQGSISLVQLPYHCNRKSEQINNSETRLVQDNNLTKGWEGVF